MKKCIGFLADFCETFVISWGVVREARAGFPSRWEPLPKAEWSEEAKAWSQVCEGLKKLNIKKPCGALFTVEDIPTYREFALGAESKRICMGKPVDGEVSNGQSK
jgi:hypothetical protein